MLKNHCSDRRRKIMMENTRLERSECDLRKVMYPVQMWHEYFRITGSRSSKNRPPPLAEIPSPWIDPRYFIVDDVFFFASDRNETKIKSSILPTRHGNFFFLFFSVHFIQSFFVHDGISITQTDVRSDLYRDSSPGWNLAQIARFHKNHSLTYVSIVH